ncbi:MAG: type II toxin-antitoxin system VapC family toxin [Cardiobacteriaceae bacterium]|nr:type II toxin-antitoxin system VapC family toxin [Cardiobacteriaceae bacterium]
MIVVDTNVISEPFKREPDARVLEWLDRQAPATLYLATMTLAEIMTGIATAPPGRFKVALQSGMAELFERLFVGRILAFDEAAAHAYARIQAMAKQRGQHIGVADGQIAAIAMQHGFAVASRDIAPYHAAGLTVINPWQT